MKGFDFQEGCEVARAIMSGKSPLITICTVTKIENGKMYLDHSKQAMKYPNRLLIIEQDALYRMVKKYELDNDNGIS